MKAFLAALLLLPTSVLAYELPTKTYSIQVREAGVRDVLEDLLSKSGLSFHIDSKIDNTEKINMKVKKASWSEIFEAVVDQEFLDYSFDEFGKLHVKKKF